MSYRLPGLDSQSKFVTTPNGGMGSIWQAGSGPAADDQGNIYFMTGNGHYQNMPGSSQPDLSDSFVKLGFSGDALQLADWYAPPSRDVLEACDLDLGSSGPGIIQDAGKVLGAGKSGILYVLDKGNMGKGSELAFDYSYIWDGHADCNIGQCFRIAENKYQEFAGSAKQACGMTGFPFGGNGFNNTNQGASTVWMHVVNSYPHVHGSPVIWKLAPDNFNLYVWPEEDWLQAYHFDGQMFATAPVGSSDPLNAAMMSMPGGQLSLSWDGVNTNTGIIWASRPDPITRHMVGSPSVSVFHDQQHFVFRDKNGAVWDAFFATSEQKWHFQEVPTEPQHGAASDVFVSVFNYLLLDEQHFTYTDSTGQIWDSYYVRSDGSWHSQPIDMGGHASVGAIFVSSFVDQQHVVFRDSNGQIWDSYYTAGDGWKFQAINTPGDPTAGNVFVSVFGAQQHFFYVDRSGSIRDYYYARDLQRWYFQLIDAHGQIPVGDLFVSTFFDQQHVVFRDSQGDIWDSFYNGQSGSWTVQPINTSTNPATGSVFASVFDSAGQQHFVYTDSVGQMWDSYYTWLNGWKYQQIDTHGHPALNPFAVSSFFDQQHFVYRDRVGFIWDSFFSQSDNGWHFQQINGCLYARTDDLDLAPNYAPCNAIGQIVHGYLEAFEATPQPDGTLRELWDSEGDPNDRVEWFAKESPPTIADGKVFLAEFPQPNGKWSDSNAPGRLLVYSLDPIPARAIGGKAPKRSHLRLANDGAYRQEAAPRGP
jgi:hypothetical protein